MTMAEPGKPTTDGPGDTADARPQASFFPDMPTLESAMLAARIGVWSWDLESNRVTWSSNLEDIHRLPAGSFDGTLDFVKNDIHPDDRAEVLSSIQEAMRTRTPHRVLYRLPLRDDNEEHWIESIANARVEDGRVVGMRGTCRDVTDRVQLHRELRSRARQQEAVARIGERALTETDLQKFFDEAVATIAEILDIEMAKILELVPGDAELLLRSGVGWKLGVVGVAHVTTSRESQAGYTLANGGPVLVDDLPSETRFVGAPFLHEHGVVSGMTTPIAGRDGRAYGVLGVHTATRRRFSEYDVSFLVAVANVIAGAIQRRQLDQRQEIMIRELRHRSGNLFSQLLALFSQTAKNSRNITDLVPKYEARVLALANAHRLITEGGWKSTSLNELLNTLLAAYVDRIAFSGPNVFLEADPTFSLSMAIHELATNASKHGSLSLRSGHVDVTWQVTRTERGLTLMLTWSEREGPAPKRQRRSGFGSRLITMVIERQLNGAVQLAYTPAGLQAELTVPLTHERWPGGTVNPRLEEPVLGDPS